MKIKVFISEEQVLKEVEGVATTWGELRALLSTKGINTTDVKASVRENGTSFDADNAPLPIGIGKDINNNPNGYDFTLFLNPVKTKSGLDNSLIINTL